FAFHGWIRDALAADKTYDTFAREIIGATGDESKSPPTVWFNDIQTPEQFVDNTAQVFLGTRIQCAQCHHHPYEKWTQDDYWGLAAFFGRVGRKAVPVAGLNPQNQNQQRLFLYTKATGAVRNKRTNLDAPVKPLDAVPLDLS